MNGLVIGAGEVGKSLFNVLKEHYPTSLVDMSPPDMDDVEILHIAFPFSDNFVKYVKDYQEKYKPKYTVIHSSVPVGTSEQCGATHSPIRGLHPNLESGIKTFVKFIGGPEASQVADYFRRAGLRVALFDKAATTEAMKLFDTLYFGVCIEFAKDVKRYCDANGLNYSDVYRLGNSTYNEGYTLLGHPEFVRPVLEPILKKIGGHCVRQNAELIDTKFTRLLKELNETD